MAALLDDVIRFVQPFFQNNNVTRQTCPTAEKYPIFSVTTA